MNAVQRAGRRVQILAGALLAIAPLVFSLVAYRSGPLALLPIPRSIAVEGARLGSLGIAASTALAAIQPAAYWVALVFVYELSRMVASGVLFSARSVALTRRIGVVLASVDVLRAAVSGVTGPVLTALGVTEGFFSVEIGIGVSAIGVFIVLFSQVMEQARRLKEFEELVI